MLGLLCEGSKTLSVFCEGPKFIGEIARRRVTAATNVSDRLQCSSSGPLGAGGSKEKQRTQVFLRRIGKPFAPCGIPGC